jgi:hypothetical protein
MDAVEEVLAVEGEFPGVLGPRLEAYRRVKEGRLTREDYILLHDAVRMMTTDIDAYVEMRWPDTEIDIASNYRLHDMVEMAIRIEKVFKHKLSGVVTYEAADDGVLNILSKLIMKKGKSDAKYDDGYFGPFSLERKDGKKWTR